MAYEFTPARQRALAKARLASAARRHRGATVRSRRAYGQTKNRPTGLKGLGTTFTPYARANKRSQTTGFNAGTIIPGSHKRIVFGAYGRLENTTRKNAVDRAINKATYKYAGSGKKGAVAGYLKKNIKVDAPRIRTSFGNVETRLGTSRGAGPTVIVRRGKHKAPIKKTIEGSRSYDKATRKRKKAKKSRTQRRKAGS